MANSFINASTVANAFLLTLTNQLVLGRLVSSQFRDEVAEPNTGLRTTVRRPPRFVPQDGEALALQDIVVGGVSIAIDRYRNVHFSVGDLEHVQSFDDLMRNRSLNEAATTLAHDVDNFLASKLMFLAPEIGTPGMAIQTHQQFLAAHTRLMKHSVPNSDLSAVLDFDSIEKIRGSLTATDIAGVNRTALERVRVPIISEIEVFGSNNLASITTGTRSGTILVNGANQNVNYRDVLNDYSQMLNIDGFGAAGETIKAGEVFTIAGVNAVNPRTGEDLGFPQQFVVLEDATSVAGTPPSATIKISPPIIVKGSTDATGDTKANTAFATVATAPADNAAITFSAPANTSYVAQAAFHREAVQLVTARLPMPMSDDAAFRVDPETGIAIRVWRGSDISTGKHIWRFDMIYGAVVTDPLFGVRVYGS